MSDEVTIRDRTDWGHGPWDTEPDRAEWYDGDLPCLALRNRLGAWCGYVAVPPGHPWHGIDYGRCTEGHGADCYEHSIPADVHGGLTFADFCQPHDEDTAAEAICHVPRPGEPDNVWWLGFDTAHCWDLVPGMAAMDRKYGLTSIERGTYRDLGYVRREVASLAEQVRAAAPHIDTPTDRPTIGDLQRRAVLGDADAVDCLEAWGDR